MIDRIEVDAGYGSLGLEPETEYGSPVDFRVAKYPDGSRRIQGAYEWSRGWESGVRWRDLPEVEVNDDGVGVFDE